MTFFDSHAHLEFVEDIDGILTRSRAEGLDKILTVGTSIEASKKAIEIAEKFSSSELEIYASCGIHPREKEVTIGKIDEYIEALKKLAKSSKKVIGIGECGLDRRITSDKRQVTTDNEKNFQKKLFIEQIKLAFNSNLPLIIHCRNAWGGVFELLTADSKLRIALRGVFHSWTGNWEAVKKALDLGFYISFSGIVTFKNAKEIQDVAKKVPSDRILIETDSPFLSPEPWRGRKNEPRNVKIIASLLADLRNQSLEDIALATSSNARRLFGI